MSAYSPRYEAALVLAVRAHQHQYRKGTETPYIVHVVHVSTILLRYGFSEEVVLAGLLHDVIEDCGVEAEEIAEQFGDTVANLVVAVSKPPDLSWEDSRAAMVAHLETAGTDVAALKAADTLHNAQSILQDVRRDGPAVWGRFKRGAEPTLRYYRGVVDGVRRWLGTHALAEELATAVSLLEEEVYRGRHL